MHTRRKGPGVQGTGGVVDIVNWTGHMAGQEMAEVCDNRALECIGLFVDGMEVGNQMSKHYVIHGNER